MQLHVTIGAFLLAAFFFAAGHLAGSITMFSRDKDIETYNLLEQTLMILGVVNYVVSDAVVVWRCWLLWGKKRWILMVPVVLFIATFAGAIAFVAFDVKALAFSSTYKEQEKTIKDYLARDDLIIWCLTLSTNIWATLMISFKAWKHRKCLSTMLRQGSKKTQLEKLMALLVESGAFYCIGFLLIYALTRTGSFVMDGVMVQIAGIYPTILIVLVNFGKAHLDNEFGYNGDGLAMQRQEATSVETGPVS
ncbi:uncharacterized protein STEHIDRAFT_108117 [Stereum hirsutum FP-91666 SS1]|uniref:uncharacterized protein n=1 Tax=Stereum hirsutum (strain FP-91666) TaxID=721885 RepID=UPI000440BFED|nr:uncharacterized protein STEHIDRAFT_108117 [Stereum hirsutum FP-91666 SS1]EIM91597.1 hypothetical protein STEHIDRAFT_108117 [Stereum hirsutum FP-91666 SS1]